MLVLCDLLAVLLGLLVLELTERPSYIGHAHR